MKIHHTTVLLLLLVTALHGARVHGLANPSFRAQDCNYDCRSDGSCSLQVSTFQAQEDLGEPISTYVPRCKPCTVVCRVRDSGIIGGVRWQKFSKDDRIDLDDQPSNNKEAQI